LEDIFNKLDPESVEVSTTDVLFLIPIWIFPADQVNNGIANELSRYYIAQRLLLPADLAGNPWLLLIHPIILSATAGPGSTP